MPFVGNHLISQERKESVAHVVQLDGASLMVAVLILTVMIMPIMVAIIADALRARPAQLDRGRGRARRQPLARDVDDLGARRAPGDRRRGRAGHGAGARRGDHALDGLGLGRASHPTRSTASRSSSSRRGRWPRRSSTTPRASRSCPSARRSTRSRPCCWSPRASLARRLGRQAADEALRDGRPDGARPPGRATARRARVDLALAAADRVGLALCWVAGLRLCLIAAAIVVYMVVEGSSTCARSLLSRHPQLDLNQSKPAASSTRSIGTFLADGHRRPRSRSRSASRSRSG